jgi:hypothetical protein
MRHFATNIWRRQKKKEVVQKLKSLLGVEPRKSSKRRLRSYRRSSMLGQRVSFRIRCLKGISGLLHSMSEVFGMA